MFIAIKSEILEELGLLSGNFFLRRGGRLSLPSPDSVASSLKALKIAQLLYDSLPLLVS